MITRMFIAAGALSAVAAVTGAGIAAASTSHPAASAHTVAVVQQAKATGHSHAAQEPPGEASSSETSSAESSETVSDGPGGHQDAAGSTVDHQFNGVE
jgi:hypothetical protein